MAVQSFSGARVRKHDVIVAKNYLTHEEIDTLNRLVTIFLDQAALRVQGGKSLSLDYWRSNVERLIEFSEFRPYLRVANVQDGWIDFSDVNRIPFSSRELPIYELRSRDILLAEG